MRQIVTTMSLALVVAVSPAVVAPAVGAQSPEAAPARTLVHDELGRLEAVIDPTQGVAIYRYDAVGNIVAIERPELTDVSIIEVTPDRGEPGDAITIQGTAFGADARSNQVTVGGIAATIDSESETTIVARIPEGATAGSVVVTTPTGSVTSDVTLSIGSLAPVIDSVSPLLIKAGDHITLTGSGFGPGPHDADVVVSGTHARVDAAAATVLSAYLPREAGSGAVSVSTQWGEVSGPDVFILPDPYTAYQVGMTARLELGVSTPVSVPAGKIGLLLAEGHAGERLRVTSPGVAVPLVLHDWRNHPLPLSLVASDVSLSGPLAQKGTYLIVVDAMSSTTDASTTLTVTSIRDREVTAIVDGGPARLSLTEPGQHALVHFAADVGDTVVVAGDDKNISGQATLFDPFGIAVAHGGYTGIVIPPTELSVDGSYTLDIDALGAIGDITVTVARVSEATTTGIVPDGSPATLTVAGPGQQAHATFDALAGTRMSLVWTADDGCLDLAITGPDTTGWVAGYSLCDGAEWFMEPFMLPTTGTYDIAVSGSGASTGEAVVHLYQVPDDLHGALATDGTPQALTIASPGQNANLIFDGQAGVGYRLSFTDVTVGSTVAQVLAPDGSAVGVTVFDAAGATIDVPPGSTSGTYAVTFDPQGGAVGDISVSVTPASGSGQVLTTASRLLAVSAPVIDEAARSDACVSAASSTDDVAALPTDWRPSDPERWTPGPSSKYGDWTTGRSATPWEEVPALSAAQGVTAISGRALRLDGLPLAGVRLSIGSHSTCTDESGRFLLPGLPRGRQTLRIDGRLSGDAAGQYGTFDVGIEVLEGRTTQLPFTVWMPLLDVAHRVPVPEGAPGLTLKSPLIPGLSIRIPAGAHLETASGHRVTDVTLTAVPIDRPPFPTPTLGVTFPMYFTVQPQGLVVVGGRAQVTYPNLTGMSPGRRVQLWSYDAAYGWEAYGSGTVTPDGHSVVPSIGLRELVPSAMYAGEGAPDTAPNNGNGPAGQPAEPVDLVSGLYFQQTTDLFLQDVVPLNLTRTYRTNDPTVRWFGVGTQMAYELFVSSSDPASEANLVLADGAIIRFVALPNSPAAQAWEARETPGPFLGARMFSAVGAGQVGAAWQVVTRDGTRYLFDHSVLLEIRDANGNTVTVSPLGNPGADSPAALIMSPNGRWMELTRGDATTPQLITSATDDMGRTVRYEYDLQHRLVAVTDLEGGVTRYAYDDQGNMTSVVTPRGMRFVENEYDDLGRIMRQTQADGGVHLFSYVSDGVGITSADYTDPRGAVRRVMFDEHGWIRTATYAVGTPEEQTLSWEREPGTNLLTATVDGLGRRMEYTYDAAGRLLTETRLAGTADAVTTTFSYDLGSGRVTSKTDPLGHTSVFSRDGRGNLTGVTDATGRTWTLRPDGSGQPAAITDPAGNEVTFAYRLGMPQAMADAVGNTWSWTHDAAGRPTSTTDPLGARTTYIYDGLDRLVSRTDALGGTTRWAYDPDGNLTAVTDVLGNTTTYTYDDAQWLVSKTDPLGRTETYDHDPMGLIRSFTDADGQVSRFAYDPVYRLSEVEFGGTGDPPAFESTIDYTWDGANRMLSAADPASGTIERTWDGLDRLLSETSPQGTVTYAYDAAGRRTTMQAGGQDPTAYTYDDAGRLTGISRAADVVAIAHDAAGRVSTQALPNGITSVFTHGPTSAITSITYAGPAGPLGDVAYAYAPDGRPASVGGSLAPGLLPEALSSATYDAAGQLITWGDRSLTYDANGNLLADSAQTLAWDARGQLAAIDGQTRASFAYDAFGRRTSRTIGEATTTYLHDGLNPVSLGAADGSATDLLTGLGLDSVFAASTAGSSKTFLRDALGSTLGLAGADGSLAAAYAYEPYGRAAVSGDDAGNPFRFTGREDDGIGLLFYRTRYQDPGAGRFISEDLLSQDGRGLAIRIDPTAQLGGAAAARRLTAAALLGATPQVGGYRYVDSSPMSGRDPRGTIIPMVIGMGVVGLALIPVAMNYGEEMGEMYYRPLSVPSSVFHTPPTPPATPTTPVPSSGEEPMTMREAQLDQAMCAGVEGTGYGGC